MKEFEDVVRAVELADKELKRLQLIECPTKADEYLLKHFKFIKERGERILKQHEDIKV